VSVRVRKLVGILTVTEIWRTEHAQGEQKQGSRKNREMPKKGKKGKKGKKK